MIGRANGVGPKLAARIANELQGKLGVVGLASGAPSPVGRRRRCPLGPRQPRFQARRSQRRSQCSAGRAWRRRFARRAGPAGSAKGRQMTERTASCRCRQLCATVTGEPVRVSVCHCLDCKKRSGSSFAVQARWPSDRVAIEGNSKSWSHRGDSGNLITFHFCPDCGSDVRYRSRASSPTWSRSLSALSTTLISRRPHSLSGRNASMTGSM